MKDILIYYNKEYKIVHAGCQQVLRFLVNRQAVDQTYSNKRGQIMSTTLLLAPPDLKT